MLESTYWETFPFLWMCCMSAFPFKLGNFGILMTIKKPRIPPPNSILTRKLNIFIGENSKKVKIKDDITI